MTNCIFTVDLRHNYYCNGVMHGMSLVPDDNTQQFFKRYHLISHQQHGVYSVYYNGRTSYRQFMLHLDRLMDQTALRFILVSAITNFYLMSDLPINWLGDLDFSSHEQDLSYGERNSEGAVERDFERNVEKDVDKSVEKKHELVQLKMRLKERSLTQSRQVGRLAIYPDSLMNKPTTSSHFCIQLKSRKTHWHYLVINRSGITLNNPKVTNQKGIEFETAGLELLPTGEQVMVFRSGDHTFELQQKYQNIFHLVNQDQFDDVFIDTTNKVNEKVLFSALPVPSTDMINVNKTSGEDYIYSQMYVYL